MLVIAQPRQHTRDSISDSSVFRTTPVSLTTPKRSNPSNGLSLFAASSVSSDFF
jgi:hypothetical protein